MVSSLGSKNSRYFFDFFLALAVTALVVFGCLFIYSSGYVVNEELNTTMFMRQLLWVLISLVIVAIIYVMNIDFLERFTVIFYLFVIFMLGITLLFGKEVNGSKSWLGIGSTGLQFSEFAKLALIILLASRCARERENIRKLGTFAKLFALSLIPMGFILMQPDLGTAIVFPFLTIIMLYVAGAQVKHVSAVLSVLLCSTALLILYSWNQDTRDYLPSIFFIITEYARFFIVLASLSIVIGVAYLSYYYFRIKAFYWVAYLFAIMLFTVGIVFTGAHVLQEYQLARLVVFLDPYQDPQGTGWHIIQSLTAIGAGGFAGTGYMQGTQSHSRFIPEQNTDFIFSIFAEEWGFVGVVILFAVYGIVIFRIIKIATIISHKPFQSLLCTGIAVLIILHFTINIGVTLGLLPIIGIPLFFLSYGGSALLMILSAIALVLNCYANRYRTY